MVKIRDLSDSQLVEQLEKYEKIYSGLIIERDKRVKGCNDPEVLYTKRELKEIEDQQLIAAKKKKESTPEVAPEQEDASEQEEYHLQFDDSEIDQLNNNSGSSSSAGSNDNEPEEEVRVTQLLKLSEGTLEELRKNASKKVSKKKVKKK